MIKEQLEKLVALMDEARPNKMAVAGCAMTLMGMLEDEDIPIPAEVFELFDDDSKRRTVLMSTVIVMMSGLKDGLLD